MINGRIKSLVKEKSFGFISPDAGGEERFFHRSALVGVSFEALKISDPVQFDDDTPKPGKGPRAGIVKPRG